MRVGRSQCQIKIMLVLRIGVSALLYSHAGNSAVATIAEWGDGYLWINLKADARWDSNVFTNGQDPHEDFILNTSSQLVFSRERGLVHLKVVSGITYSHYVERNDLGHWDPSIGLTLSGFHTNPQPALNFDLAANWLRSTNASAEVGALTESENSSLSGGIRFLVSQKSQLAIQANYNHTDYEQAGLADSSDYAGSFSYFLVLTPKLSFQTTGRYRVIEYTQSNQETTTFSMGVNGAFSPKVTASTSIGLSFTKGVDKPVLFYQINLSWAVGERTSLSITGSRDYSPSSFGNSSIQTSLGVGVGRKLTDRLALSTQIGVGRSEWDGLTSREDEFLEAGGGLSLRIGQNSQASFAVNWTDRSSDEPFAEYNRLQLTLSGGTRF